MGAHNVDKVRLSPSRFLPAEPARDPERFRNFPITRFRFLSRARTRSVPTNPSLTNLVTVPLLTVVDIKFAVVGSVNVEIEN